MGVKPQKRQQQQQQQQQVWVYGIHACLSLLELHAELVLRLDYDADSHNKRLLEVLDTAKNLGLACQARKKAQLDDAYAGFNHQGIVAVCRQWPEHNEKQLGQLIIKQQSGDPLLLVLDGVQDPHNLGACLRTAAAAGVTAVIVPKDNAVGLTPTVAKVAAGALGAVPLVRVTNLARCLKDLKQANIWLAGLEADAEQGLYQSQLTGPLAIVMGAEGQGLRELTRKSCDYLLKLPMYGQVQSLNVSVATGITLYEVLRQREIA